MSPIDALSRLSPPPPHAGSLKVRWFDQWHGSLDDALRVLPEMENCPHELYRMLATSPGPTKKRIALVTRQGNPVAVAALRARGRHWEPVTESAAPHSVIPAAPDWLFPALSALRTDLWVNALDELPDARIQAQLAIPTCRTWLHADYEAFWRASSLHQNVRTTRHKTSAMVFRVNEPGAAEWALHGWARRWGGYRPEVVEDRILGSRYLAERGRHYCLTLHDGETIVAANTFLEVGKDVIWQVTHRLPEYDRYSVGTRILDLSFRWAAEVGYERMDLGGGHEYKARWAPVDGERWSVNLCPLLTHNLKRTLRGARSTVAMLHGYVARARRSHRSPSGEHA